MAAPLRRAPPSDADLIRAVKALTRDEIQTICETCALLSELPFSAEGLTRRQWFVLLNELHYDAIRRGVRAAVRPPPNHNQESNHA